MATGRMECLTWGRHMKEVYYYWTVGKRLEQSERGPKQKKRFLRDNTDRYRVKISQLGAL